MWTSKHVWRLSAYIYVALASLECDESVGSHGIYKRMARKLMDVMRAKYNSVLRWWIPARDGPAMTPPCLELDNRRPLTNADHTKRFPKVLVITAKDVKNNELAFISSIVDFRN